MMTDDPTDTPMDTTHTADAPTRRARRASGAPRTNAGATPNQLAVHAGAEVVDRLAVVAAAERERQRELDDRDTIADADREAIRQLYVIARERARVRATWLGALTAGAGAASATAIAARKADATAVIVGFFGALFGAGAGHALARAPRELPPEVEASLCAAADAPVPSWRIAAWRAAWREYAVGDAMRLAPRDAIDTARAARALLRSGL